MSDQPDLVARLREAFVALPAAEKDWGHEDCEVCSEARDRVIPEQVVRGLEAMRLRACWSAILDAFVAGCKEG